jgi:RpiR family carbohydrate utilization transcriptional regulator
LSLSDQIKDSFQHLSPAEQQVAKLVLANPQRFVSQPVSQLAKQAGVSTPTVVRFCRSLGFEGLSDFKLKLAGSLNDGVPFVHTAVNAADGTGDMAFKVIDNVTSAIATFRAELRTRNFDQVITALVKAIKAGRRIEFYGVGNSGIVAQDAQHKFFRLGCNTVAYADGHMQIMAATMLKAGDCAVVISNSGSSRDLLDTVEIARKNRATTVAITASGSPLAGLANIVIAADHPEQYDRYSPMVSRLLHLLIIDILTTGVALRLGPDLLPQLSEIKKNLRAKRYRAE